MAFRNASNTRINYMYAVDNSRSGESEWERLAKAACHGAGHQSEERYDAPKCHPETREAVLKDIMSWVDSNDPEKRMMWLNAPAGAGKSAIAQTIAEKCHKENKLIASFFFSRTANGTGRDNGHKLVPTIAYQLGTLHRSVKELIINELEENDALLTYFMEVQIEHLVLNPLTAISTQFGTKDIPHLVIVDGLDECNRPDMQSRILKMIARVVRQSTFRIKFLLASRPDLEIRNTFKDETLSRLCLPLTLDNRYNPDKDIDTYLRSEFSTLKRKHTLASILSSMTHWTSEEDLKTLVKRSSGQFIYASTVLKYISDDRRDPCVGLSTVMRITPGEAVPYAELDALYTHILSLVVENLDNYDSVSLILQVLVHMHGLRMYNIREESNLRNPRNLAVLLQMPESHLLLQLVDLHSIINIPEHNNGGIRFFHASFGDFLNDSTRSRLFHISRAEAHTAIGNLCLSMILENAMEPRVPAIRYAYYCFMYHWSHSGFNKQIAERLMIPCESSRQALVNRITKECFGSPLDFSAYDSLSFFYKLDVTAHSISETATPLNDIIKSLFGKLPLEEADNQLRRLKHGFGNLSGGIFHTVRRRLGLSQYGLDSCLYGEMIESYTRGRQDFLSDTKCEQIFRSAYKCLVNTSNSVPITTNEVKDLTAIWTDALAPACLKYLLRRVKPSLCFKTFLQEISQWIESTFITFRDKKPDEHKLFTDNIHSLKKAIGSFIQECEALEKAETAGSEFFTRQIPPLKYVEYDPVEDPNHEMNRRENYDFGEDNYEREEGFEEEDYEGGEYCRDYDCDEDDEMAAYE